MEFRSLRAVSENELLAVFNEAFANYFVPLQLTSDQLRAKLKADKVDPDLSAGAFINGRLAGFMLHGFDRIDGRNIIYNGGTGVLPRYRNRRIVKQLYGFIVPVLRAQNVDEVRLEVIAQNERAIKAYEQAGFTAARKLCCYKGAIQTGNNPDVTVREISGYDWAALQPFWDFSPTWQNSRRVLDDMGAANKWYGAYRREELVGYAVFNPAGNRVQQFAVAHAHRRIKIASSLFAWIAKQHQRNVSIINVDARAQGTHDFLKQAGLENFVDQWEMRLEL